VNDAAVARINPWLMAAIVAVLLVAAALELLAPTLIQVAAGMLHGASQAPAIACSGTTLPC
jgi:hypothetical protein